MRKLLYINSCVNRETSRTMRVSTELVNKLKDDYEVTELVLEDEELVPLNSTRLNERSALLSEGDFNNAFFNFARQFAEADCIVIAALYWDCGFPAMLKIYIENISVPGIAYKYSEEGIPTGLCKAEKLYYVTSRGGFVPDEGDLGYKTIEAMAKYYGISQVECISLQGTDIPTTDIDEAIENIAAGFAAL